MKRNAIQALEGWMKKKTRKPLLLYGARQVGKTYLLKEFGKTCFDNTLYLDLEKNSELKSAFDGDLSPKTILTKLSQITGHSINTLNTLIIIDEIQASNRALTSLKYFCEEMPQAYIVAAGSLLGVAVNNEGYSAPVGKVDILTLRPMSFDEFLMALGQEALIDGIKECFDTSEAFFLHERALDLYRTYLLVGGMPEPVKRYTETGSFDDAALSQNAILDLYVVDMAKYAKPYETARIIEAWKSIPSQLAKENKKFQYKTVRSGGRAMQYETALAWLETTGLINRCTQISSGQLPLALHENRSMFKMYMLDTGLLAASMGVHTSSLFSESGRSAFDAGAITENYVAQALSANGFNLSYWTSQGKAEVDFIVDLGLQKAVPLEVKSSSNVRSRSLSVYCDKYEPPYSIKTSTKNFGFENGVRSIPLYAMFCVKAESDLV